MIFDWRPFSTKIVKFALFSRFYAKKWENGEKNVFFCGTVFQAEKSSADLTFLTFFSRKSRFFVFSKFSEKNVKFSRFSTRFAHNFGLNAFSRNFTKKVQISSKKWSKCTPKCEKCENHKILVISPWISCWLTSQKVVKFCVFCMEMQKHVCRLKRLRYFLFCTPILPTKWAKFYARKSWKKWKFHVFLHFGTFSRNLTPILPTKWTKFYARKSAKLSKRIFEGVGVFRDPVFPKPEKKWKFGRKFDLIFAHISA